MNWQTPKTTALHCFVSPGYWKQISEWFFEHLKAKRKNNMWEGRELGVIFWSESTKAAFSFGPPHLTLTPNIRKHSKFFQWKILWTKQKWNSQKKFITKEGRLAFFICGPLRPTLVKNAHLERITLPGPDTARGPLNATSCCERLSESFQSCKKPTIIQVKDKHFWCNAGRKGPFNYYVTLFGLLKTQIIVWLLLAGLCKM